MDAVAELGAEHVVDEPVLGQPRHAPKRWRSDDGVEVMTIAADNGHGPGNPGLDARFQLLWSCRHAL